MPHVYRSKGKNGKPHPRWRFQYTTWEGKRKTATGTTSRAETEKLALRVQSEQDAIRKGWTPPPRSSDRPRPFSETVHEYLAWGESQGGRGGRPWGKTHARMRRAFLKWWEETLGFESLADLAGCLPRVEEALRKLQDEGRTGKTLRNYTDGLAAFCDWCELRGYLDRDPLEGMRPFDATPKTHRRAMTPEELRRLLDAAPAHRRILYEAAALSGLRAGELRSLRTGHLNPLQSGLHLDAAWTKNRKPGFQPLPSWLVEKLAAYAASGDADRRYRALGPRRPASVPSDPLLFVPKDCARPFDEDLKAVPIPKETDKGKLDFHALRTTFVSYVFEAGASVKEAQTLARHATPDLTLNTYARSRDERVQEVAERVGGMVTRPDRNITGAERKAVGYGSAYVPKGNLAERAGFEPAEEEIPPSTD